MSKKRKVERTDSVGKWEFTLDREQVHAAMREVLITAQKRTKEIRENRLKRGAAA